VILNLVTNAIESMNSAETRVLSIRSEIAGQNGVRVSIADTGSGIDLANLNRLFETNVHDQGPRDGNGSFDL
jgi:signal transduction histidine kinase